MRINDYIYTMTKAELIEKLRDSGQELTNRMLVRLNTALYFLNKMYDDRFIEQVFRDPQGLRQSSSALGQPRAIHLEGALNELGFDARIYGAASDLYINGHDVEVKGSFTRHTKKKYGEVMSGNYNKTHSGRVHIFTKGKVDVDNVKMVSVQIEVHFAASNAFESSSGKEGKTNISTFNAKLAEEIGIWEAVDLP